MNMNEFIKIEEAAEILNVSKMTLRRWDNAGKLKAYRHPINNWRLYKKQDIENLMKGISND
jgi:MerR family transcriptional regulator, copper efflux regulator